MKAPPTIEEVVEVTAQVTKVPAAVILNPKSRAMHVSRARHIAQYVARTLTHSSWPVITEHFHMVHPSAYVGAKQIEAELAKGNATLKKVVNEITKALQR